LENENEGYSKSVKSILGYAKRNYKVHGTIANLISTDEKYEYAIEVALGGFIQNVVVEDEIIAKNLITYLNNNYVNIGKNIKKEVINYSLQILHSSLL